MTDNTLAPIGLVQAFPCFFFNQLRNVGIDVAISFKRFTSGSTELSSETIGLLSFACIYESAYIFLLNSFFCL